jgi:phage baseplate assembly protein W
MNPNFGTIIWNMLFEPLTNDIRNAIITDVSTIVGYDPRLKVGSVTVNQIQNGLQIIVELAYVNSNQVDALLMNFNGTTNTLTTA